MSAREHAPDLRLAEPRKHDWGMDGHCVHCGVDRFSRWGLRDEEICVKKSATAAEEG